MKGTIKYKSEPWSQQKAIVEDVLSHYDARPYWALFCDMGVGKTKMTIDIHANLWIANKIKAVMVFAPLSVYRQWGEELEKHSAVPYDVFFWTNKKTKKYLNGLGSFCADARRGGERLPWFVVNIESFASPTIMEHAIKFLEAQPTALVVDEATKIKSHKTHRWKGVNKLAPIAVAKSVLTGTSIAQGMAGLWSIYNVLKPRYFGMSQTTFQAYTTIQYEQRVKRMGNDVRVKVPISPIMARRVEHYYRGICSEQGEGSARALDLTAAWAGMSREDVQEVLTNGPGTRYKHLEEVLEWVRPCTYTLKKTDCRDMPPKIYQTIGISLTTEQKRVIAQMQANGVARYEGQKLTILRKVELVNRVLQVCGGFMPLGSKDEGYTVKPLKDNPKLTALMEEVEALGGNQAIIWAVHIAELEAIMRRLQEGEYTALGLYGANSLPGKREEDIAAFKRGEAQFLVTNPAVGAFGLNLDGVRYQYWYTRPWSVEQRTQGEDRTYRITTQESITIKDLYFERSLEERVMQKLQEGKDLNACIMDLSLNDIFEVGNG